MMMLSAPGASMPFWTSTWSDPKRLGGAGAWYVRASFSTK
jgi:hypothetical protein